MLKYLEVKCQDICNSFSNSPEKKCVSVCVRVLVIVYTTVTEHTWQHANTGLGAHGSL